MCKKNLKKLKTLNNNSFNKVYFGIKCKKCHSSIPLFNLKRIFSSVLVAAYYACQSSIVYAQIEAYQNAPSGHKPIMDAAHNGVPVVHIAPPNSAGVSHNQFENFNVNGNGAILNNSNQDVQTQLAGWIAANPQFGQNSASVIVNEVMSTNPSYLSGAIEVAGKLADVIIANPNGITCDGCGFINTGRASLVVGRPEFSHDGLVESFQNLNGQLIIGGKGLNVTNILQLDLIAKSMTVSGEVWANKLNAVLSSNKVNYKNLSANKNDIGGGGSNGFALDIKAMGGMHAKQLFIVATDKGLGVNSEGRLSSLESDLVLNANGDIKLKDIFTKNNLEISGSENIFLTGKVISENSVKLKSERDIENLGVVSSNGILNINSLNLNNKGELIQNSNNSIILDIKNKSENSGIISGKGEIKITAEKIEDKNGKYESLSKINLASKDFKTDGMSFVSQNMEVKSNFVEIIKTNITTSDSINVISDNLILNNNSKIVSGNKVSIESGTLKSELSEIISNKEININSMSPLVNNNSKIISENALNINSNGLENNNGYISANSASLNFNRNEVNNQSGKIIVENDIDLNSSYLNNSNGMIVSGKNVKINTNSNNLNNSNGVLKAEGFIDVNAINSEINNTSGKIISNEKITLNSLFINNNYAEINSGNVEINSSLSNSYGIVNSTNSIELKGDLVLNNEGKILAEKNVIIDSNQKNINNNYGNILSNGKISLNSNSIDNNSGFISGYKEIIVASNYISNNEGRILSASGDINITKGELNNNFGIVNARDSIKINSENINNSKGTIVGSKLDIFTNDIDNRNGEILGKNKIDISSKNIDNSYGSINSENILKVNSSNYDVLNNYGKISAKNDLQLFANTLQNLNGNISSGNKGIIETNKIENINGEIISKVNLNINSTKITNSGQMQSSGNLDVNSSDLKNYNGNIIAGNNLNIKSDLFENIKGKINSGNDLIIDAKSMDNTDGQIKARSTTINLMNNGNLINKNGEIFAEEYLKIKAELSSNDGGKIRSNGNMVFDFEGTNFNNAGGTIESGKSMQIFAKEIDNSKGKLKSGSNIDLQITNLLNKEGEINAKENLKLKANSVLNILGKFFAKNQDLKLGENGLLSNENGELFSEKNLSIQSGEVSNNSGKIIANESIIIDSGLNVENKLGLISSNNEIYISSNILENNLGNVSTNNLFVKTGELNNTEGKILASGNNTLEAGNIENKQGKIHGQAVAVTLTQGSSISNSSGELLAEKSLNLQGGVAANDQGLISAKESAVINTQGETLNNNSGKVQAIGTLTINSADIINKQGEIVSTDKLQIESTAFNNETGKVLSSKEIAIKSRELNNKQGEIVVQNTGAPLAGHIVIQTQGQIVNNEEGKILASGNNSVNAGNIENKQGKIHGQAVAVTLTQGSSISNSRGELLAEKSLNLQGGVAANDQGLISAKESAVINTQGEKLNNNSGKVQAIGTLTINSADIINKQGEIVSTDKLQIESTAFNNETGKVLSSKEIAIKSRELNNKQGKIVVQNTGAPLAGHIAIQTQGQIVNNEEGKILASGNNSVNAGNIENKQGKIHGQAVAVTLTQGSSISNTSGELLAEKSLNLQGGVAVNDQGLISAKESAVINTQGEKLNNNSGKVQAVGTLTINSADISNKQGEIVSTDKMQIESTAFNNETGKVLSSKEIAIKSKELNNKQGKIVVQNTGAPLAGHIAIQTQGQKINNEEGKILASGNNSVNAGNIENKQGKIHGQAVAITLTQGSSISNSSGELLAEKSLNLQGGVAANDQGLISAKESAVINTQGETLNNNSGKVQAVGTLTINSADISNKQGEIVSTDKLQIESTAFNNETGKVLSSKEIAIKSKELNNKQGEIVVQNTGAPLAGHIVIQTQGQKINNEEGKILASGNNSVNAGNIENKQGKIHGQAVAVTLTQGSSISNSSGELLAEKSLNLQGGVAANDQGLISAKESAVINTQGETLNNNSGKVQAVGTLTINSADISNKQGEIVSTDKLQIESTAFNNETGKVLSSKEIAIKSRELNNKQGEIVVQNTGTPLAGHIAIQTQGQKVNNEEGKILASGNNTLEAGNIENKQGKIHGQAVAVTLTQGSSISNSSGELLAEKSLNLQGGVAANDQGLISAKESAVINTQGEKLNNEKGRIQAQQNLAINSAQLINKQGNISSQMNAEINSFDISNIFGHIFSKENLNINSSNIDNTNGKINGQDLNMLLAGSSSISNNDGKIIAEKSFDLKGGLLTNVKGEILANHDLNFHSHGLLINNDQGSIHSNQNLDIQSGLLTNRQGSIQSERNSKFKSGDLINDKGKIFSQEKIDVDSSLISNKEGFIVAKEIGINTNNQKIENQKGTIHSKNDINIKSNDLHNEHGSILAGNKLNLTTANIFNNYGYLAGQSGFNSNSQKIDNTSGLILTKKFAASLGMNTNNKEIINKLGTIVSSNDLSIQSGDIKNENGKLFGQSIDIKLMKGTNLTNDNGSIISKSDLSITGGLNSNKFGLIAAHGNSNINSDSQTVNNSQGVIQANKQLTLKTENLNNNQGVISSVDQLKINSKILDNDKGKIFTTGSSDISIETNKQKISNNEGKISASGNLALNASELISNKGVVSAENVDLNLNNGKLENDHGKVIADEKLNINSGFISNKYGTLGSNNKLDINTNRHNLDNANGKLQADVATIQSGNFDNQNGVINVGNKLNVNSELFNNNNGIIVVHSINNNNSNEFILDTNGKDFSNVGGKIFANVLTKILNTSNIKNNNGYLFAKDLTIKIDHLQNNHGVFFTSNHLKIDANELSNQNGRIVSSNTITANISNAIQNQQGQINATGNLNLKTQNFNNSSGQIASLSNLILNANQINNSSGTIHGNGASKIEASSTNNNSGHIYSNGSLVLDSSTLQNENGNIGTTQNLEINSSSNSLGGKIISQGNMNLNISSNYTNTTDLAAGGNLNLSTAGLTNSNKIQANGNLKINTSGDSTNNEGATIAAKSAELNAQGKFTNLGKFDGENVTINAANIENKAQILGNNLNIKGNEILNHEQGKIVGASANGSINFTGGNLTNEKGGEILSAGNISFSLDKLTNISTKIYASGNINFNSTDVTNKKENYVTEFREVVYNYSPPKKEKLFEKGDIVGHKSREKITDQKITYGEEIKEDSAVGEIKAGGNMRFAGNVLNDKSVIISAGTMIFNQASTNNASYIISRQYTEKGHFYDAYRVKKSVGSRIRGGGRSKYKIEHKKVDFNVTKADNAMEKHTLTEAIMVGNKAVGTLTQAQNINLSATQNIVPSLNFSTPVQNSGVSLAKLNKDNNNQGSIQSSLNINEQVLQNSAKNNQSFVGNKLSLQAVQKENAENTQLQTYGKVVTDNILFRNGSIEKPNLPLFTNRNTQFSTSKITHHNADRGSLLNYSNTSEVITTELILTSNENLNFGNISIDNKNNENIEINTFENVNNILNSQETEPFSVQVDNGLLKQSNVFQYFDPAAFNKNYALNMFDYFAENKQSLKQNYQLSFTELEQYSLSNSEQTGVNFRKETNSKYTDYNNFYASDYYFNQLKLQPDRQLKKYGDNQNGRLTDADDNLGLTGQTFLTNYQATEKQFAQIVNAGKQFTQSYQISPGTNLSAESMKQLTSNIIANVDEKTNKVEKGLRNLANQDLKKHGGFIAFGEMDLKISGDFKNEGTFFNADGKLEAQNIVNDGGKIIGNNTQLEAKKDFKNIEGMLLSDKQKGNLFIKAGNKIFMETKAVDIDYTIDGVKQKLTEVGAVASVSGHNISLYSEGDIEKIGTQIDATGKLQQYAKGNIDAKSTVLEKDIHSNTMNGGYLKEKSTTHFIGNEKSGSDNILIAEKDINYKGVDIESKGKLSVSGENVTFKAEVESNHDEYYSSVRNSQIYNSATTEKSVGGKLNANNNILIIATGEKTGEKDANGEPVSKPGTGNVNLIGTEIKSKNENIIINANNEVNVISQVLNNKFASWSVQTDDDFTSSTTTSANSGQNSQGLTQSVLSANNIFINAGDQNKKQGNINIQSGQLVASKDIQLNAGNEINIISQELKSESHSHSESSTSGLMGTSVSSFTVGQKDEKQKGTSKVTQNVGSTVATKDGNISINAGGKYYQKGSNILSVNGSVDVEAESIKIEHTKNIYIGAQEREVSVNGLNVGARNEAFSLGQNLYNNYNTSQNTTDPRMQSILAAASGLSVYNTLSPALDKKDPKELAKLKVSTGIGGSSQKNSMSYYNEEINASSINAGNNVSLKARGAGADSKIEIYGSDVKANNKLTLNAEGDIIANAAKSISKSSSDALSYSWQAGAAFNVSSEGVGVAGEVTGTLGQSGTNKYEVAHRNSHLEGSKQVEIVSGGNTNLIGGTIRGDKVTGDIKGNLYIESLQDLSKFSSDAKSGSLTGTACVPPICAGNSGASFSYTQTDMDSYYQSVGEQSGIFAGSQGFQLKVGGNTHLKGAVISSNDEAIKNKKNTFETGTFSSEDIVNKAWYEASQFTVAGSVGTLNNSLAPTVPLYSSDSKSNTTYSGVSGGSFVIRDDAKQRELTGKSAEQTIAETNRDTSNTHEKLAVIFDEQKITTEFQIVTTFNNELNTFINNQANKQDNYKKELEVLLDSGADPNSSEVKEAQSNLETAEKWGPGGSYRQIAQALSLAISGNVGGSNVDLIKGFAANYLQSLGAEKVKELAQHLGGEGSPAHVALHAVLGCAAGSIKGTCEQTAVGAAAGVVVNELLKEDKKLTAEEKEKKLNITTGLIGSLANALGEKNVAAVTSGAQIESENNSLKKLDHISLGVSLVDAARLKMIKMQSDNLKQELEEHIGEYATVGDYVFNSNTFESELLMLSEGKKTFAEFLDAYGKSAVLEIILNKSLSRLTELKPELKSILQPALLNVQKKGEDWLLNEGLSKQEQNKLTEKYEDTYKLLSGKTSLKELERTKGIGYLLEVGSELNKKGIHLDKKGGTEWQLVRIDSKTQKEKVLNINLVNGVQEGYQSTSESKNLKDIIEGKTTWEELANKKGKDYVERLVKSKEAEGIWNNELINPNTSINGDKENTILKKWDEGKNYLVENDPKLKDKPSILGNKAPYSSREIAEDMKDRHGKDNVSSTTVPPLNKPNVKMAGKSLTVETGTAKEVWSDKENKFVMQNETVKIVFDKKGYPIFDDVMKVEVRIPAKEFRDLNYEKQMVASTLALKEMIENSQISKSTFTEQQLKDIFAGKPRFEGYTWHHHQDTGRMQLVPRDIHKKVAHIGWEGMQGEQKK
ncbi:hemagglutinin repeat-containing protein [Pigmentibacter ruber]